MRFLFAAVAAGCVAVPAYGQSCNLEGVWQLVSVKVDTQAVPLTDLRVKLITNGRFSWVGGSPDSVNTTPIKSASAFRAFKTMFAGGGTYLLEGTTYTEQIEYAPDVNWIGLSLPFICRTEADRFIQTGTLPVFENGQRVRDQRVEEMYRRLPSPGTAADVRAVSDATRRYMDAWLANDVAAITSHLDEHVVISAPPQPDIKGRAAAREVWGKVLVASKVKALTLRQEPITVSGNLAMAPGEFDETIEVQGQADPLKVNGRYLAIWQRGADGAWKILRFMAVERAGVAQ